MCIIPWPVEQQITSRNHLCLDLSLQIGESSSFKESMCYHSDSMNKKIRDLLTKMFTNVYFQKIFIPLPRPKHLKESRKLSLFPEGYLGDLWENPFHGVGVDIFWNDRAMWCVTKGGSLHLKVNLHYINVLALVQIWLSLTWSNWKTYQQRSSYIDFSMKRLL